MDGTLGQIYSLVLPQAPYVIAAYGILWIALVAYVAFVFKRLGGIEKQLVVVEEVLARKQGS